MNSEKVMLSLVCQIGSMDGRPVGMVTWHDMILVATDTGNILKLIEQEDGSFTYYRIAP